MIRIIRRVILTLAVIAAIAVTVYNIDDTPYKTTGTVYLVDEYVDTYYEMLSDNVGLTTINGISNVYINMKADGYSIYNEEVQPNYVDVTFVKNGYPAYRYYFTYPEGRITIFSSEYESSYLGVSYINERKE